MNKDLKNLLQLVIKAGIEQGILGGSSRVCRKQRETVEHKPTPKVQSNGKGKEE